MSRNADTLPTAALRLRYNAQAVYIVGGRAAVPESKLFELNVAEQFRESRQDEQQCSYCRRNGQRQPTPHSEHQVP